MELLLKLVAGLAVLWITSRVFASLAGIREWLVLWSRVRDLPGVRSWWLIGSLPEFKGGLPAFPQTLLRHAAILTARGESVMKTWLGPILRVHMITHDSMKVIVNSTIEIAKGRDYDRFAEWIGDGLVLSLDEPWKHRRRQMTPLFHFQKIEEYAAVMDEYARKFVGVLDQHAMSGREVDIYQTIKCVSLDIIGATAMGIELGALYNPDLPYIHAIESYLKINFSRNVVFRYQLPFYFELCGQGRKSRAALRTIKETTQNVVRERMSILERGVDQTGKRPDFLDVLLEEHRQGSLPYQQLLNEVDTFMFGGYDTSATALSWTIWCLATHPEVQERLYAEIHEAYGDSDAEYVAARSKELVYLNAVVNEAMRVYPPIPLIQRRLRNDMQVGKHTLPAGLTLILPIFALHHNEEVFGKDHWTFNPENFLGDKEYPHCAYMPFSAGPRNCIGQKFAMREIRIILLHMIGNFKFSTHHAMLDNKVSTELVLKPTLGIPVRIERRQKAH